MILGQGGYKRGDETALTHNVHGGEFQTNENGHHQNVPPGSL